MYDFEYLPKSEFLNRLDEKLMSKEALNTKARAAAIKKAKLASRPTRQSYNPAPAEQIRHTLKSTKPTANTFKKSKISIKGFKPRPPGSIPVVKPRGMTPGKLGKWGLIGSALAALGLGGIQTANAYMDVKSGQRTKEDIQNDIAVLLNKKAPEFKGRDSLVNRAREIMNRKWRYDYDTGNFINHGGDSLISTRAYNKKMGAIVRRLMDMDSSGYSQDVRNWKQQLEDFNKNRRKKLFNLTTEMTNYKHPLLKWDTYKKMPGAFVDNLKSYFGVGE